MWTFKAAYKNVWGLQGSDKPLTTESNAFNLIQCSAVRGKAIESGKKFEKKIVLVFLPSPSVLRCYARMSGGGKQMKSVPACDQRHHPSCMLVTSQLRPSSYILPPPPSLAFVRRVELHLLAVGSWVPNISPLLQLFSSDHRLLDSPSSFVSFYTEVRIASNSICKRLDFGFQTYRPLFREYSLLTDLWNVLALIWSRLSVESLWIPGSTKGAYFCVNDISMHDWS